MDKTDYTKKDLEELTYEELRNKEISSETASKIMRCLRDIIKVRIEFENWYTTVFVREDNYAEFANQFLNWKQFNWETVKLIHPTYFCKQDRFNILHDDIFGEEFTYRR